MAEHNRQELDPPPSPPPMFGVPAAPTARSADPEPPERPAARRAEDPAVLARLDALIAEVAGGSPSAQSGAFEARLVRDLLVTALKLIPDGRDTGELKLMSTAMRELRYAYRVFGAYPSQHKVSIFGSARTPPDHPDYVAAREFGRLMAAEGWMVITGAGDGIMKAGHEGPGRDASFGVAIRLPFETTANTIIAGDRKLINFRYFFTRKLMFLSQSEAIALCPGGFGTLDEAFEALTLIQTGKSSMIPIVLVEGAGQDYWEQFDAAMRRLLLDRRFISPEDVNLYHICRTPAEGVEHIVRFYRNYHSSRYVKDDLVIRLKRPIRAPDLDRLTDEFAVLIKKDSASPPKLILRGPFEAEDDHLDLPRISFPHARGKFGLIRKLIDRINDCETA